jgi:anti-sigma B factor antagonist
VIHYKVRWNLFKSRLFLQPAIIHRPKSPLRGKIPALFFQHPPPFIPEYETTLYEKNYRRTIMEIQKTISQGMMIVTVAGKLDARTTPDFQKTCAALPAVPMVLDLTGLEYLSSSGLRALLQLKRDFARNGIPVVIAGCQGLVDKVIRVSGFEQIFSLYPTVPEALAAVAEGGA